MKLKKVVIHKYKSIEQEQIFEVEDDVTILVGMNESGKTATLEALAKSNYFSDDKTFKYSTTHDYPRKEKKKMDKAGISPIAITCTYEIDEELQHIIEEDIGVNVLQNTIFSVSTKYDNGTIWSGIDADVEEFVRSKLEQQGIEDNDLYTDIVAVLAEKEDFNSLLEDYGDSEFFVVLQGFQKYLDRSNKNWSNRLESYVINEYLITGRPKFLYYDEYYMLPSRISLNKLENEELEDGELKTANALLELADLNVDIIMKSADFEDFIAELEATEGDISAELFEYWTTNTHLTIEFKIDKKEKIIKSHSNHNYPQNSTIVEHILDIRVKNTQKRVSLPLKNRSKGFNWFFSFLVWFKKIQEDKDSQYIILLDEPGLNLHASAQADLLRFIEDLAPNYQIVYSTHSPFMVPSDKLHRVRTVLDTKKGTQISDSIQEKDPSTLFPLQAALGYDIAQNLFIAKKNLLIEGVSDLVFLQTMSGILEAAGRQGLNDGIVLVPTGGLEKVATFISLMRGSELEVVCLLDSFTDPKGKAKLENHIRSKIIKEKNVRFFHDFVEHDKADIEDLFDKEDYLQLFNAAFKKYPDIYLSELNAKIPQILIQIKQHLISKGELEKNKHFNHYRPANELAKQGVDNTYFQKATLDRFEEMFKVINGLF